jgi:DNA repair protein RadA/Sms
MSSGFVQASSINPTKVSWLWENFIPSGKLSVVEGDPGTSKSTLVLDLAARLTRGETADGSSIAAAGCVISNAEDGLADTLIPRLIAAGADLNMIYIPEEDGFCSISEPKSLEKLEELIDRHFIKLLVIDPLAAHVGVRDLNSDQEMRKLLTPLKHLAEKHSCTIILIRHLNKKQDVSKMYRGGGSIGISGAARAVLSLERDEGDPSVVHVRSVKQSLAKPLSARFRVVEINSTPSIEWMEAEEAREPAQSRSAQANRFVLRELTAGAISSNRLNSRAREEGLSTRSIEQARKDLGVIPHKTAEGWFVSMPAPTVEFDGGVEDLGVLDGVASYESG